MKIEEIRGKSQDQLEGELSNLRKELFDLRFKSSSQSLTNPARIRLLRRTIARVQTTLRAREQETRAARNPS